MLSSVALTVGFSLAAPWLARSWRALSVPLRIALYAPILLGAVVLLRNVTGTNEALPFAISPWPAVPVFGLEVGALGIAMILAGAALGVVGGRACARTSASSGIALCAAGVLLPALLLFAASRLGLLPFT